MKKVNKVFFIFQKRKCITQSTTNSIFLTKKIIYHQPSIDFTSNTGFLKKKLGLWWNEEEIFLILWKRRRRRKRAREKNWKLFFLFTLRLEKIEQSYSIKKFLSNQLFFRNFLVLYFSTCCKNDDVLENLMVQTVDVRMNVVCKPINQKYYTIYIIFILNFIYQPACSFFVKKNPCYMYLEGLL